MQRMSVIGLTLLGIAAAVLIAVGAYHAGAHHTLVTTTTTGQVVHVVGPGYNGGWGWGFFPFGFFLFPLFFFGFIFLMRGLFWGRRWHGPNGGGYGGGYRQERERMFEDWHRRQHEQATGDHPSAGGEPSSAGGEPSSAA